MNNLKVQLFNAKTGALEHEENSHNYLVPAIDDIMKAMSRLVITQGARYLNEGFAVNARAFDPFRYLVLTNNSDAVDTNESLFDSETVIGYAYKVQTYSGTDVLRGSINAVESNVNHDSATYIFDFATDKSNGTFQSLFFSESQTLATTRVYNETKQGLFTNSSNCLCDDGTYIYFPTSSTTIERYLVSDYSYVDEITLSQAVTNTIKDITTDGTHLYTIQSSYVAKYTLAGTFVGEYSVGNANNNSIVYRSGDGLLYLGQSSGLYSLTTSGASLTYIGSIGTTPSALGKTNNDELLIVAGGSMYVNNFTLTSFEFYANTTGAILGVSNEDSTKVIAFTSESQYVNNIDDSPDTKYGLSEIKTSERFNVGSRIRLDAPVTKTNSQTMKITYTFNFS